MLKLILRSAPFSIFLAAMTVVVFIGAQAWADAPKSGEQQLINIDVKDAPIEQVLRMLAKAADVNIIVGQDVKGNVEAITLRDVTIETALKMIARSMGFYWYKEDNVYFVTKEPPAEAVSSSRPTESTPAPAAPPAAPVSPVAVPPAPLPPPPLPSVGAPMEPPRAEPKITTAMLVLRHVDAGDIALMFGGVIAEGGGTSSILPSQKPSQWRRATAHSGGKNVYSDVFGLGFGMPRGGSRTSSLGQEPIGGIGGVGGIGGRGGRGVGVGGVGGVGGIGAGGQMGVGGIGGRRAGGIGGGGALSTMLPGEMEPPIAFLPQNALLVRGTQEDIDRFKEILDLLDKPSKQVEIATKFIEVQTTADKSLGIDWSISNGSLEFWNQGFAPGEAINNVVRFARGRFEAQLNALLSSGRATVINEPHVITQNNQFAEINFYTEIPYFSAIVSYNQYGTREVDFTADFVTVENSLWVVPRINADDSVTMYLEPMLQDQVGEVEGPNGERIPIITSQYVSTQVRVADGETIVLGGLIRKDESTTLRETPLLSRIPIIGRLFQARRTSKRNSELLIFVTPRIVRDVPTNQ